MFEKYTNFNFLCKLMYVKQNSDDVRFYIYNNYNNCL